MMMTDYTKEELELMEKLLTHDDTKGPVVRTDNLGNRGVPTCYTAYVIPTARELLALKARMNKTEAEHARTETVTNSLAQRSGEQNERIGNLEDDRVAVYEEIAELKQQKIKLQERVEDLYNRVVKMTDETVELRRIATKLQQRMSEREEGAKSDGRFTADEVIRLLGAVSRAQ